MIILILVTLAPDCDQHYTSTVRRRSQLNVNSCVLCTAHKCSSCQLCLLTVMQITVCCKSLGHFYLPEMFLELGDHRVACSCIKCLQCCNLSILSVSSSHCCDCIILNGGGPLCTTIISTNWVQRRPELSSICFKIFFCGNIGYNCGINGWSYQLIFCKIFCDLKSRIS